MKRVQDFTDKQFIWHIDSDKYDECENHMYTVTGWVLPKNPGMVTLQGIMDCRENMKCKMETSMRKDVADAFPTLKENGVLGFRCVFDMEDKISENELFQLYAVQGERKECIFEKKCQDILQYSDQTLEYCIDTVRPSQENIVISGWCIDECQEYTISVFDEERNKLEVQVTSTMRADVQAVKGLTDEQAFCGFELRIPREIVKTNSIFLVMENHLHSAEYVVDIKEHDRKYSKSAEYRKLFSPKRWKRNLCTIHQGGFSRLLYDIRMETNPEQTEYQYWVKMHRVTAQELKRQRKHKFAWEPLISILIPLYNTDFLFLKEILDSVQKQSYENWELCLADASETGRVGEYVKKHYGRDSRIKYQKLTENAGISENTNKALKMASGEYVLLSDHDDVLELNALFEIIKVLNQNPKLDIIYTDEDKVSFHEKKYFGPHFKPDFNLGMLRSNNYICHISVIRKTIMDQIHGFRREFDGAQDYDLMLRCVEKTTEIHHIPKILYHWRCHPNSTAANPESKMYAFEAGRKALAQHYERCNIKAKVENTNLMGYYRTRFVLESSPLVSIIIPTKDHIEDLQKCIESIQKISTYQNYEIIVIENNSENPRTFSYYKELEQKYKNVKVIYWNDIFNYASINNFGAEESHGEFLVFLNNDVEIISPEWIEEMLGLAQQPDVGIVGVKLYFPNYTIQHAGVVIGLGGIAGHIAVGMPGTDYGYQGRSIITQDYSAVTAACMMVRKDVFEKLGGFDEKFQVAYNDIDFCLKARKHQYRVVFTPYAELYHHESKSRGKEDTPEKQARFQREVDLFEAKWSDILKNGDPYYNPNLTLTNVDCSLRETYDTYRKGRDKSET